MKSVLKVQSFPASRLETPRRLFLAQIAIIGQLRVGDDELCSGRMILGRGELAPQLVQADIRRILVSRPFRSESFMSDGQFVFDETRKLLRCTGEGILRKRVLDSKPMYCTSMVSTKMAPVRC